MLLFYGQVYYLPIAENHESGKNEDKKSTGKELNFHFRVKIKTLKWGVEVISKVSRREQKKFENGVNFRVAFTSWYL